MVEEQGHCVVGVDMPVSQRQVHTTFARVYMSVQTRNTADRGEVGGGGSLSLGVACA